MSATHRPPGLLEARPPDLPACLSGLGAPCYVHRTPRGLTRWLSGLVAAIVGGLLILLAQRALAGRAGWPEAAMALFLLLFLGTLFSWGRRGVALARPIHLAADRTGVWFVGADVARRVPWSQVESLDIGPSVVNSATIRSVVIGLRPEAAQALGLPVDPVSRRRPIGQLLVRPEVTLEALAWLKSKAIEPPAG
jgi:hypothetical protein